MQEKPWNVLELFSVGQARSLSPSRHFLRISLLLVILSVSINPYRQLLLTFSSQLKKKHFLTKTENDRQ
jgi:hypothetical protein